MVRRRCMSCWRPYWGPTGWRARCAIDLVICGATAVAGIVGTWVQRRLQATAPGAAHSSWGQYNRTGSAEALAMPAYPQCLSITRCMCIFHATDRLIDSVEAPALGRACAARLAQGFLRAVLSGGSVSSLVFRAAGSYTHPLMQHIETSDLRALTEELSAYVIVTKPVCWRLDARLLSPEH